MQRLRLRELLSCFFLMFGLLFALSLTTQAEMRKDIEFAKTADGVSLTLDAYVPDGAGLYPAVIIVHGGGFRNGDKQTYVPPLFEPFQKEGYVWLSINYRLYPQVKFPAPVDDIEAALRYVKANAKQYKIDLKRVVLCGESAGASLISYVAVHQKNLLKLAAVVAFYGVHDWELRAQHEINDKPGQSIWREFYQVQGADVKRMREVSPINYLRKGLPPFLLIHGTADTQVNYQQSVAMQKKMQSMNLPCELITVPGGPHGMGVFTKYPDTPVKMFAWLKKTLR
jgi:acetyl esterase